MYTASIYFMGKYRPAHFQAETKHAAVNAALRAIGACNDRQWFVQRLEESRAQVSARCTMYSADHGCRGVALRTGPHDPFLDSVTCSLPLYPDLDYSQVTNA